MAAGMQQHRIALLRLFESGQHVLDQHALGGDVEEGIGDDIEAGGLEDRRMVRPAGQAEMHAPASEPGGEVGGKAQRAGAAGRLHAGRGTDGRLIARHQRPEMVEEDEVAFKPQIGLALLPLDKPALGLLHRPHDGGPARLVAIDADTEIHRVGARIVAVEPDQGKERIVGQGLERVEHGGFSVLFTGKGKVSSDLRLQWRKFIRKLASVTKFP